MEKEELYKYFIEENHSREETAKYFGVTEGAVRSALRKYGIKKSKSDSLKTRYKITVSKEEVYKYYIEENHTRDECLEHFNVSLNVFKRWLTEFGIKKDMNSRQANIEKHFNASSPFALKKVQNKARSTIIEKYGSDNIFSIDEFKTKSAKTKLEKYGSETYNNREKASQTYKEKTGYNNPFSNPEVIGKITTKRKTSKKCKEEIDRKREKTNGTKRHL